MNIRGLKSKKDSLDKIVNSLKPTIVMINETQLRGRMKVEIEEFVCWSRNRGSQGGGGVATAVSAAFSDSTVGVAEGEGEEEYIVTRMEKFRPALTIINYYGEQRKTGKEEVESRWRRLVRVMEEVSLCFCGHGNWQHKTLGRGSLEEIVPCPQAMLSCLMLR